jgi:hypothetical protein
MDPEKYFEQGVGILFKRIPFRVRGQVPGMSMLLLMPLAFF